MAEGDRDTPTAPIDGYRHRLDHLRARGQQLRTALASSPDSPSYLHTLRVWQGECATTVSQLSGGRKSHWLSRAFSTALLVPVAGVESASVVTIIDRLLEVLDSAGLSLAGAVADPAPDAAGQPPRPRFTMIEHAALRSSLERAYLDGQDAFKRGESALALMTFCSILETVITDALERHGLGRLAPHGPPPDPIVSWPFAMRLAMAERAGIIAGGCARLPQVAREYRNHIDELATSTGDDAISLRDAKLTSDVLHVILRDLSPGR